MPPTDDCDPVQDVKHARETSLPAATERRRPTPAEALANYEAANLRKAAAKREQEAADAAWVAAAEALHEAVESVLGDGIHHYPVLIGGKLVDIEWDELWSVSVRTPPVVG